RTSATAGPARRARPANRPPNPATKTAPEASSPWKEQPNARNGATPPLRAPAANTRTPAPRSNPETQFPPRTTAPLARGAPFAIAQLPLCALSPRSSPPGGRPAATRARGVKQETYEPTAPDRDRAP